MKRNKLKITVPFLLGLLLVTAIIIYPSGHIGAESASKGRIAYVDLWAVFNAHPQKPVAEGELNKLAQSMQSELEDKAKDLPKDQQQNMLKDYQSKLNQREQELIQNIIDSIKKVVVKVAADKEVKMVLDKKDVIYGGYDMTQDVIDYIKAHQDSQESKQGPTGQKPVQDDGSTSNGKSATDGNSTVNSGSAADK